MPHKEHEHSQNLNKHCDLSRQNGGMRLGAFGSALLRALCLRIVPYPEGRKPICLMPCHGLSQQRQQSAEPAVSRASSQQSSEPAEPAVSRTSSQQSHLSAVSSQQQSHQSADPAVSSQQSQQSAEPPVSRASSQQSAEPTVSRASRQQSQQSA